MNTKDAIKSRRAIKEFDPDHEMPQEVEKELLSLGMLAPTAFNIQNWRFVVVKDPGLREQIKAAAGGQAQVSGN